MNNLKYKSWIDGCFLGTSLEELVAALEEIEKEELENSSDNFDFENNAEDQNSDEDGPIVFPGQEEGSAGRSKNKGIGQGKKKNGPKGSSAGGKKGNAGNRKNNNNRGSNKTASSKNNRKKGNNGKNKFGSGKENKQNGRGKGKGSGSKRNNGGFKNSVPLNGLYSRPN